MFRWFKYLLFLFVIWKVVGITTLQGQIFSTTVESYVNRWNNKSYRVDDSIKIGKGTNPDGTYKFIYWQSSLVGTMDQNPLTPGYAFSLTGFKRFSVVGSKKAVQMYIATLKLSGNTGYNCVVELDNAFRYGELIDVHESQPVAENRPEPRERVVIRTVPSQMEQEVRRVNKMLDDNLKVQQREIDSIKRTRSFQDLQLREQQAEIQRRILEATTRASEIRKLTEDTSAQRVEIVRKLEELRMLELQNQQIRDQLNLEKAEIELRDAELARQIVIRNFVIAFASLAVAFLVLVFYLFRINRKNNRELKKRNKEILFQKEQIEITQAEIEIKNRQITNSITYAKRIQSAILPSFELLNNRFRYNHIYFNPRDVVSGDFYWYHENERYQVAAVVDCTGHGVPGAFMSLIGANLLHEIVEVRQQFNPSSILTLMNQSVISLLKQTGNLKDPRDGMDLVITVIDRQQEKVFFGGAGRPLWIVREGNLLEYKNDKFSIGGFFHETKSFHTQMVEYKTGDQFIMFTDGITDQQGGENKQKVTTKRFRQWLMEISQLPEAEQGLVWEEKLAAWKGNTRQTDDMLMWRFSV